MIGATKFMRTKVDGLLGRMRCAVGRKIPAVPQILVYVYLRTTPSTIHPAENRYLFDLRLARFISFVGLMDGLKCIFARVAVVG